MSPPLPPPGSSDAGAAHQTRLSRRSVLELARIYVSSAACGSALEVLDRIPQRGWDEESRLIRAEALLGLGRNAEAEGILGPPVPPHRGAAPASPEEVLTWHPSGEITTEPPSLDPPTIRWVERGKSRTMSRRERLAYHRFLLQLRILHRTGRYREVLHLARACFDHRTVPAESLVARAATVAAQSLLALRRPSAARTLFEEILELYRRLRSTEGIADTLMGLANCHLLGCRWDEADALYQESRFRYETMGSSEKALASLVNLGVLRARRGDLSGGRSLLEQALGRARQLGSVRGRTTILLGLALVATREGRIGEARRHLLAAMREARRTGARRAKLLALEIYGELCLQRGRLGRADRVFRAGLRHAEVVAPRGDLHFEILRRRADLAARRGDWGEARLLAGQAQEMAREYGDLYEVAAIDRLLAEADAAAGELRAAIGRARAARDQLHRIGETFERSRIELLLLRLELRAGILGRDRALARAEDICRPFKGLACAPVILDGERLREETGPPEAIRARAAD